MRVIVLTGPNGCGKTGTQIQVYEDLLINGESINREPLGGDPRDFSDIVKLEKRRIAFFTMGDYAGPLIEAIRNYDALDCDILVCACNDRFVRPFRVLEGFDTIIIRKQQLIDESLFDAEHTRAFDLIINSIRNINYIYSNCNVPTSDTDIICCESCGTKHILVIDPFHKERVKGIENCKGCGIQLLRWDGEPLKGEPVFELANK